MSGLVYTACIRWQSVQRDIHEKRAATVIFTTKIVVTIPCTSKSQLFNDCCDLSKCDRWISPQYLGVCVIKLMYFYLFINKKWLCVCVKNCRMWIPTTSKTFLHYVYVQTFIIIRSICICTNVYHHSYTVLNLLQMCLKHVVDTHIHWPFPRNVLVIPGY